MNINLSNDTPWMTIVVAIIGIVVVIVGGVVVILGNMDYEDYCNKIIAFAGAAGILGVGRGIAIAAKKPTNTTVVNNAPTDTSQS